MKPKTSVVITGIGPLCSLGIGKEAVWNGIKSEESSVVKREFVSDGDSLGSFYHHPVKNFNISTFGFDKEILTWIKDWKNGFEDLDLLYLAAAASLAIKDSGIQYDLEQNNIGLVTTHENPGLEDFFNLSIETAFDFLKKDKTADKRSLLNHMFEKCERLGYDSQSFMYLFFVAKILSIHGFSLFVNNACASGLYAIETAAQLIKTDRCKAVVVSGIDRQQLLYKHLWLKSLNLFAADGVTKPFSKDRNGFVMGEGGGGLVLEDKSEAEKRGAFIYAEYVGGGFNLECGRVTLPTVEKDYYVKSIQEALQRSNQKAHGIDWIVPHGIGTRITDLHEARAIAKVFAGLETFETTAFKGYVGHNLGSCALLETAILLMCMKENHIPKSLNSEPLDPEIKIRITTKTVSKKIRTCLKLSCGFAGYNGAIILQR